MGGFGTYMRIDGVLMCFATETEAYEYLKESEEYKKKELDSGIVNAEISSYKDKEIIA